VAVIASRENAVILTSDIEDLERLAKAAGGEVAVASIRVIAAMSRMRRLYEMSASPSCRIRRTAIRHGRVLPVNLYRPWGGVNCS